MEKVIAVFIASIMAFFLIAGVSLALAFPIKWCWNYVMPYLFNLKEITWGHAWCLNFLCGCLIKATQSNTNKG